MRSLPAFILTRLLSVIVVVVTATTLVWLTFHLSRTEDFGDPRPLVTQLLDFLQRAFLHLDLGRSWDRQARPVSEMLGKAIAADVSLLIGGLVVGTLAGMAGGAVCAARPGSLGARALEGLAAFFIIAPVYWVGLMLILVFSADFGRIPIPGFETNIYEPITHDPLAWVHSLIVPWIVLAAPLAAMTLRMTRAAIAEIRHEDYLRTALAKGLSERTVMSRHALPAASSPVLALVGVNMATLVTNVVLVEHAFSIPGIFRLTPQAMNDGNLPLLQGMTVAGAAMVVAANLLVDIVHGASDPRVRAGARHRLA